MSLSLTFNALIPQPGDNPSVSQGEMLQNFKAIGDVTGSGCWTNQDHYPFGTGTDGQHKQVRLPAITTPPGPPFVPTVFTKNDSFVVPQLYYYTGTAAQSSLQYYVGSALPAATQCSSMILGGLIIKSGFSGTAAVVFTNAFPHGIFSVVCTAYNSGSQINLTLLPSPTGFTTNGPSAFFWIAIGN